jgi:hypothetical protein
MSTTPNKSDRITTKKKPPSKAWLEQQAAKLKMLIRRGSKLKIDFIQNAREQGKVLAGVRKRLEGSDQSFAAWVEEKTDIGVSTAYLWCEVAEWWNDPRLQAILNDSNPLELTLRQVRDAIRDARQERGEGKPGSGRPSKSQTDPDHEEGDPDDPGEGADGNDDQDQDIPDTNRWEQEATKAEAEAAEVEGGKTTEPESPLYAITVMVFSESDQTAIYKSLSNWSPTGKTLTGTKQTRSVSVHVPPSSIGKLLHVLGETLEHNQPQQVRVSIEL